MREVNDLATGLVLFGNESSKTDNLEAGLAWFGTESSIRLRDYLEAGPVFLFGNETIWRLV